MVRGTKVFLMLAGFLLLCVSLASARLGLGISFGQWKVPEGDLGKEIASARAIESFIQPISTELKNNKSDGIVEILLDGRVSRSVCIGISAGYGIGPLLSIDEKYSMFSDFDVKHSVEVSYHEFPLSLYIKTSSRKSRIDLFAGGGITYIKSVASVDFSSPLGYLKGEFGALKFAPHAYAGFEIFLTRYIALNASVRYLFSAVLSDFKSKLEGTSEEYSMIMSKNAFGECLGYKDKASGLSQDERLFEMDYGKTPILNFGLRLYFGKGKKF